MTQEMVAVMDAVAAIAGTAAVGARIVGAITTGGAVFAQGMADKSMGRGRSAGARIAGVAIDFAGVAIDRFGIEGAYRNI